MQSERQTGRQAGRHVRTCTCLTREDREMVRDAFGKRLSFCLQLYIFRFRETGFNNRESVKAVRRIHENGMADRLWDTQAESTGMTFHTKGRTCPIAVTRFHCVSMLFTTLNDKCLWRYVFRGKAFPLRVHRLRPTLRQQFGPEEALARAHGRQAVQLPLRRLRQVLHAPVVAAETHEDSREAGSQQHAAAVLFADLVARRAPDVVRGRRDRFAERP